MTGVSTAPTTAERIRSTCARAGGALLAVEDGEPVTTHLHHLLDDGSIAVAVPLDAAACVGTQAVLELADYAPLPLREPVRALVWMRGRLAPVPPAAVGPLLDRIAAENLLQIQTPACTPTDDDTRYALLRLQIDSVVVTDTSGAESVEVAALLAAQPDPFCAIESCWLRHLDSAHRGDVLARLASKLPAPLRRGQVRPLALDRYGVRLRVETEDGDRDVRLPFRKPVDDVTGLSQAIRLLMGCPFANGLRARRF
jgi:hypothetical protein